MTFVTCVVGALGTWATWHHYLVGVDYVAGEPGVGVAAYVSADNTAANIGLLWLMSYGVTAVTFLTWSWRVRFNSQLLCPVPHRLAPGWVIGGWFVPVVPLVVLEDVWRTSRPHVAEVSHARELPKAPLVRSWWAASMACVVAALWLAAVRGGEPDLDTVLDIAMTTTVLAVLQPVAATLEIAMVRHITEWQSTA
ncbi:DUF4328 domain-containing protein [Actinophytocola sp.]|uniref:DUF4328 domain-containing protein n=1 Tax=Actinophytocola sp. TaxID=1872138 RepID=UPI00389B22E6